MEALVKHPFGPDLSMRTAYGKALVEAGKTRDHMVVLSADVSNSDHSYMFQNAYPDRFFNVGIAEQALVDVAVGFAKSGYVAVANTFAFLFASRALEMVQTHLCYGQANVKLAGAYAGLSDSFDGPTHHSINDLAVMRSLPRMTVIVPSDPLSVARLLPQAIDLEGAVYFRLCRNEVPEIFTGQYAPRIGKGIVVRPGTDVSIIGCGVMLCRCLQAAGVLAGQGINARVIEMHTIKPLDHELILQCAEETRCLVAVEEHSIIGGLGGAVAQSLSRGRPVPLECVGIADTYAESGPYHALMDKYGLGIGDIVLAVERVLLRR